MTEYDFNRALEFEAEAQEADFIDMPPSEGEYGIMVHDPVSQHGSGCQAVSLSPGVQVGAASASQSLSTSSPRLVTSSGCRSCHPAARRTTIVAVHAVIPAEPFAAGRQELHSGNGSVETNVR